MFQVIDKLGHYEFETRVSNRTTHLICAAHKRNVNLLRGIIRGTLILDYNWIIESKKSEKWLPAERFEIQEYAKTVKVKLNILFKNITNYLLNYQKVRSERQAFGNSYKMDLYSGIGGFYVFESLAAPVHHVKELITMCGGTVVTDMNRAKYLIGDKRVQDLQVIIPTWIYDSICQYNFLNHRKYLKN